MDEFVESVMDDFRQFCDSPVVDEATFEAWHISHDQVDDGADVGSDEESLPVSDTLVRIRTALNLEAVSFDELFDVVSENAVGDSISIEDLIAAFDMLHDLGGSTDATTEFDVNLVVPALAAFYVNDDHVDRTDDDSVSVTNVVLGM